MSILGKTITRALLLPTLMSMVLLGADVKVRVSGTEVVEGSALEVQIIAEGKNIVFPEIEDVGGFPIEGKSSASKLESTYINGTFSSKSIKTLRFEFYPETNMQLPAFKVTIDGKTHETKPVSIRVVKPSEAAAKSVDGYSLRITSSKKSVYVGEPFVVTVDFFEPRNSSVTKVEYTPPKFKSFFSQSLGDEKLKRSAKGTRHELQYLVSAKKEGSLTILPPKARVGLRSFRGADRDPWGFFANDVQWRSVRAKPLVVEVKPIPSKIDLVGLFKVDSSVDKQDAAPNSPVSYTLRIFGEGSLDDLANPKFDLPGVTVYGDEAKISSKVLDGKVVSQYERKYVFISDKDFVIPSLSFRSFDYLSGQKKRLYTKTHKIKIAGGTSSLSPVAASPQKITKAAIRSKNAPEKMKEQNVSVLEDTEYYQKKDKALRQGYSLAWLVATFVLGMLFALLLLRIYDYARHRKKKRSGAHYSTKEALKLLYPHTNHNKKVETMVRKLYALENGDAAVIIDRKELDKMVDALRTDIE